MSWSWNISSDLNLEDRAGMASANIRMMQDATKRGEALTFVLKQAVLSVGSHRESQKMDTDVTLSKDGKVEKAMDLSIETMENPSELTDFHKMV